MKAGGMMNAPDDSLAAKRYRQICESNIPVACAEKLVRRTKEPPVCQSDMQCGPPDFIGIGSMKAGTSWWYSLVTRHPQVYSHSSSRSARKELHFFDLLIGSPFGPEQVDEYHGFFCRPPGMICGEWTPRYISDIWTPRAIKLAAPNAKLLLLLRDPVNRFVSGVTHSVSKEAPRKMSIVDMWSSQFARGLYHEHISRYLKLFDRSQLLVLQFERCVEDPRRELERTFRFLGLDMPNAFAEDMLRRPRNMTKPGTKIKLPRHLLACLVENYQDDVRQLGNAFPEIDLELWENFRPAANGLP